MHALQERLRRLWASESGPTTTEYAVLLAVIVISVLATMGLFGEHMGNIYAELTTGVDVF